MAGAGWESMWARGIQPGQFFDAIQPLPALVSLLQRNAVETIFPGTKVLVPGCGRGYAPIEFAKHGFTAVGLDISPTAIESAQSYYNSLGEANLPVSFQHGSFFDVEKNTYDLGYDYTFFCALDPGMRDDWSTSWSNLLKDNGLLITAIFPIVPGKTGGPPYSVNLDMYKQYLEPKGFELLETPMTLTKEQAHEGRGDGKTILAIWSKSTTSEL